MDLGGAATGTTPSAAEHVTVVPANQASLGGRAGDRQVFAAAGFTEVSHPSPRRHVMRIDFTS